MARPLALPALVVLALLALPTALADHTGEVRADQAAALGLFPTPDELDALLARAAQDPWVRVVELGASHDGHPLRVLEITDRASPVPMEARVVTLLLTQQHGNEPAGTGAAVVLLEDFLAGKALRDGVLSDQVLLLLPMVNPDGAAAQARGNGKGIDINRDHVGLDTPEAQAVHEVLHTWDVHFALDHHEYSGIGVGDPFPLRIYDYDLTTMVPNHGNVRKPTRALSDHFQYEVLWPAAQKAGYTANEYGEVTVAGVPVQHTAGGPDPGILRNSLGLNNVAGLLIETRVDGHPNPFHDAQRRIDIHRLVMDEALAFAHREGARLVAAKRASEQEALAMPAVDYLEGAAAGPIPAAFRVQEDVTRVFALHGLAPPVQAADGAWYRESADARQGLVAALLHPASTRAVAAAEAADAMPAPLDAAGDAPAPAQVPAAPLALVVALVALAALARRR